MSDPDCEECGGTGRAREQGIVPCQTCYPHVPWIVEHDQLACKTYGCTTAFEVRCGCGWGQGTLTRDHASRALTGHLKDPKLAVVPTKSDCSTCGGDPRKTMGGIGCKECDLEGPMPWGG